MSRFTLANELKFRTFGELRNQLPAPPHALHNSAGQPHFAADLAAVMEITEETESEEGETLDMMDAMVETMLGDNT